MSLRIGVLGVGRLGEHHARLLSELPEANLVGVYDIDVQRAEKIARKLGVRAYATGSTLLEHVEAVTIAVPTPAHHAVARECLEMGLHCLVEKPLTSTVEEAEGLIELADKKNRILQVGHVERFNPAVVEMCRHVSRPVFIEANRLGPYDPRVSHIGVVLDLMIHDLDIVLSLVKRRVERLDAIGASVFSPHEDIAKVTLFFEGGCRADISASRISFAKFRKIRVYQHDSYISLDYSERSLKIYKRKTEHVKSLSDVHAIHPRLEKYDPLQRQLAHFIDCVRHGREPLVSGQHGRDAVELAKEILKAMQIHHVPEMVGAAMP
jgi:predicted dehydrogenase